MIIVALFAGQRSPYFWRTNPSLRSFNLAHRFLWFTEKSCVEELIKLYPNSDFVLCPNRWDFLVTSLVLTLQSRQNWNRCLYLDTDLLVLKPKRLLRQVEAIPDGYSAGRIAFDKTGHPFIRGQIKIITKGFIDRLDCSQLSSSPMGEDLLLGQIITTSGLSEKLISCPNICIKTNSARKIKKFHLTWHPAAKKQESKRQIFDEMCERITKASLS